MRKCLVLTVFIAFLMTASSETVLKLGSLSPAGSPWDKHLREISEEWLKITEGNFNMKIYSGGTVGDEIDMIRKLRVGQLDAAGLTGVGLSRIVKEIMAIQMPRKIETNEELFHVLGKMKEYFEKKFEKEGFKIIVWTHIGWVHFFSKKPVVYPDDLKKLKLWVWEGDANELQSWKEQGFNPIPLPSTEIMTSLQSGMTEALATSPLNAASYQWFGLANNMCAMRWAPFIGAVIFSKRAWDRIPQKYKDKMMEAATSIGQRMQDEIYKTDDEAVKTMLQYGLKINEVPPAAVTDWNRQVNIGFSKLVGVNFEKEALDLVDKYLNESRNKK